MKPLKFMLIAFAGVLLLAGGLVYYLLGNLNQLVEGAIEDMGTEMAGSEVSLEGVNIDLSSGRGELLGLVVANPPGYKSDFALKFNKVALAIDVTSLTGPVVRLTEVTIKGGQLNAEQKGATSNLSELLESIESATASEPAPEAPTDPAPPTSAEDVRLYLERFVLAGTKAKVIVEGEKPKVIKVPDVRRKGIGDPDSGLTAKQMGDEIMHAIIEEVQKAVGAHLATLAVDAAKDKIKRELGLDRKRKERE